ncbi:MAG: helix-turn-helix transcriptional regulator [Acidimicrobiaceae bacterium]|nr:helix-turn-helix transcriptional regulator [Acidimicrobiaceae bacterium]
MSADAPGAEATEEMALAQRLRFAREYIGLLQEDVATALDIPRASVSAIESGKRRVSSLELRRLGRLYRRPVAWLLEEEGAELEVDAPLARVTEALSDHDKRQVLRFAEFLAGAGRPGSNRAEWTK